MSVDADDELALCEKCVSYPSLRKLLVQEGSPIARCKVCGSTSVRSMPVEDDKVRRLLRALIRMYYSEFEYNQHVGGEPLEHLLFGRNRIFDLDVATANASEFGGLISVVEDGWYPSEDSEVSLGGGYWEGGFLFSPYDWPDSEVFGVLTKSLATNYYQLVEPLRAQFRLLRAEVTRSMAGGLVVYRARKGFAKRYALRGEVIGKPFAFDPFEGEALGATPIARAGEGRFNRTHVSVFYGASNQATALAEVRPDPGQIVSVGSFTQTRPLLLADFSEPDVSSFLTDERFALLSKIVSFTMLLSVPVSDDTRPIYLIPQLVAEVLRAEGFDGLVFDSTLEAGKNYAVFGSDCFSYVPASAVAHVVETIKLRTSPLRPYEPTSGDQWEHEPHDLPSTLSGLVEMHRNRMKRSLS